MTVLRSIYYSFPVQLVVLHLRNHLLVLILWLILAMFSTGLVGRFFGMHYLMLTPEYWGEVNFWSFFITGGAFGGLVMIWHLTTYLLCSNRFPFLATLSAPFTKFCLNNSLIPLGFVLLYISCTTWFQWHDELTSGAEIVWNISGFLAGTFLITSLLAGFLHLTNKDIYSLKHPGFFSPKLGSKIFPSGQRLPSVREIQLGVTSWNVHTYITERFRVRLVRSVSHYDPRLLERVFRQNHWNAVMVQVAAMLLLMVQGVFLDSVWLRIPAAATVFLLASMGISFFGAVTFWFRQWSTFVIVGLFVLVNLITSWGFFNYRNRAYGLDYEKDKRAEYSYPVFEEMLNKEAVEQDKAATIKILEKWLAKNRTPDNARPKMVFICVSGGGMRSALWTMQTLQKTDYSLGGKLLDQAVMITGASGGMLGAAYIREAMLRRNMGERLSPQDPYLIEDMGKDLLNPISFAVVSNDLFFPISTFRSGNFTYRKDRGYLFENQLNENCRSFFGKRLADYRQPEAEASIPMMIFSPYILNDARRMLISPQGVSYLMRPHTSERLQKQVEIDGVDFGKLFAGQQADSLAFTSALRMNATYPFILPNVWLPTKPGIEAMDAGLRDNYGISLAIRFAHVFKDWIEENTGGVVFVHIRCFDKISTIKTSDDSGVLSNLFTPASAAAKMTDIQDFEQDNALSLLGDIYKKGNVAMVRFHYHAVQKKREASMSFHLSKREKLDLMESFYAPENQAALKALKQVLR
jgi:hypothetical protein